VAVRAYLIGEAGTGGGRQRWPLDESVTTIGRSDDNDISLPDREVSRRHAQVRHDGTRFVLVDLGSKNGTRLNGAPVAGAASLADGDLITVGVGARLRFRDLDATASGAVPVRNLELDEAARDVRVRGQLLRPALAPQQFRLLALLASQPGRVFTHAEIAAACYGELTAGVSEQAIEGVVRRLRARLVACDPQADRIAAVRGHGYKLSTGP
jgi:hypothetical protein